MQQQINFKALFDEEMRMNHSQNATRFTNHSVHENLHCEASQPDYSVVAESVSKESAKFLNKVAAKLGKGCEWWIMPLSAPQNAGKLTINFYLKY